MLENGLGVEEVLTQIAMPTMREVISARFEWKQQRIMGQNLVDIEKIRLK